MFEGPRVNPANGLLRVGDGVDEGVVLAYEGLYGMELLNGVAEVGLRCVAGGEVIGE